MHQRRRGGGRGSGGEGAHDGPPGGAREGGRGAGRGQPRVVLRLRVAVALRREARAQGGGVEVGPEPQPGTAAGLRVALRVARRPRPTCAAPTDRLPQVAAVAGRCAGGPRGGVRGTPKAASEGSSSKPRGMPGEGPEGRRRNSCGRGGAAAPLLAATARRATAPISWPYQCAETPQFSERVAKWQKVSGTARASSISNPPSQVGCAIETVKEHSKKIVLLFNIF